MKEELILWFMGLQTSIIIAVIAYLYRNLKEEIKEIKEKISDMNERVNDMNERIHSIDKRLYGVETMLHMQECCVLKEDKALKKAD